MPPIDEILLEASAADLDPLLAELPREQADAVIREEDLRLEPGALSDRILALLGARTHQLLFAPPAAARALLEAARRLPQIRIERLREISHATFSFRVEAFSAPVRDDIRGFLCASLPPGVELRDFEETEERDPEVSGVELFAPAHAYTWRAKGAIEGDPGLVLDLQRRAEAHDFCHVEPLRLTGREINAIAEAP